MDNHTPDDFPEPCMVATGGKVAETTPGGDKVIEALARIKADLKEALTIDDKAHFERQIRSALWVAEEALAEVRRTPAETVSREAIALDVLRKTYSDASNQYFYEHQHDGMSKTEMHDARFDAGMLAVYDLQLPALQPVAVGEVIGWGWKTEFGAIEVRTDSMSKETIAKLNAFPVYASRPPVPSVVGGVSKDREHLLSLLYRLGELWPQEWKTDLAEAADHAKAYLEGQGVEVECSTLPKPQTEVEFDESVNLIRAALQSALYPRPEGDELRRNALYRLTVLKPLPLVSSPVVGVPTMDEIETAWLSAGDGDVYTGLQAIHKMILTRQPDMGAVVDWEGILQAVIRESVRDQRRGRFPEVWTEPENAPGHAHSEVGIWDSDNGDLAGKPCAWCLAWNEARKALAAPQERG